MIGEPQSKLASVPAPQRSLGEDAAEFLREARRRVDGYEQRQGRHGGRTTRLYTAAVDNCIAALLRRLAEATEFNGAVLLGGGST